VTSRKFVRGAELFVAEPAAKAQTLEDFLERRGVREDGFEFLADFVATIGKSNGRADSERFGRRFKGKKVADGRAFGGGLLPFCFWRGRRFRADAEELAVLGQAAIRGVKEEIVLVDPGRDRLGADFRQCAKKGFGVGDAEFDFDLGWHEGILRENVEKR
jgi:hypothetical protein